MSHDALIGIWKKGDGEQHWRYGMTAADLSAADAAHFAKGLRLQDLTINNNRYAAIWRPGKGGAQHWHAGMTIDQIAGEDEVRRAAGLRLHSLSADDDVYAAVWRPGTGEERWCANEPLDKFKALDDQHFAKGLRIHYMSIDDDRVTAVWKPGTGAQRWIANTSLANLMATDRALFKTGLVMHDLVVDDSGLLNLDGCWGAVWREGKGSVAWSSALPASFTTSDADRFKKGMRMTRVADWQAGGLDFDLGEFFAGVFKAIGQFLGAENNANDIPGNGGDTGDSGDD